MITRAPPTPPVVIVEWAPKEAKATAEMAAMEGMAAHTVTTATKAPGMAAHSVTATKPARVATAPVTSATTTPTN